MHSTPVFLSQSDRFFRFCFSRDHFINAEFSSKRDHLALPYFFIKSIAAAVIASVPAAITFSASGFQ